MAQAIIHELRHIRPDAQVAFTFFSPSAERVVARVGADVSGYLPFDTRHAMTSFVRSVSPSAIGFVRTEIWPTLVCVAREQGVRTALVNAALGRGSSRLRGGARFLLGPAYSRLDAVGAVAAEDGARFSRLDVAADRVFITGDARFDQVWQRVQSLDTTNPLLATLRSARPLIVAGSTWPEDEAHILPALARGNRAGARLAIAPHDPTEENVARLERLASRHGLSVERLSVAEVAGAASADVVIVDRIGILADLYAVAAIAYVGGGFGKDGLHSVVEPAALGVPVLYGPAHGNAREAGDLAQSGGGFIINDTASLASRITTLLDDATALALAGIAARTFVESRLGGAAANAALLAGLL
jgi:3-deoxy-D-manno-octulosonic-acid transferase